jgi:hypothetical protein
MRPGRLLASSGPPGLAPVPACPARACPCPPRHERAKDLPLVYAESRLPASRSPARGAPRGHQFDAADARRGRLTAQQKAPGPVPKDEARGPVPQSPPALSAALSPRGRSGDRLPAGGERPRGGSRAGPSEPPLAGSLKPEPGPRKVRDCCTYSSPVPRQYFGKGDTKKPQCRPGLVQRLLRRAGLPGWLDTSPGRPGLTSPGSVPTA